MPRSVHRAVFAVLAWVAIGCDQPSTYEVTGTVTLDGRPVSGGRILLVSEDGQTSTAAGDIEGGTFLLRAPPGAKVVKIEKTSVIGPDSEMPQLSQGVPERYNTKSTLRFTVTTSGPNHLELDLTSNPVGTDRERH